VKVLEPEVVEVVIREPDLLLLEELGSQLKALWE
jgi:hypothetical protein